MQSYLAANPCTSRNPGLIRNLTKDPLPRMICQNGWDPKAKAKAR